MEWGFIKPVVVPGEYLWWLGKRFRCVAQCQESSALTSHCLSGHCCESKIQVGGGQTPWGNVFSFLSRMCKWSFLGKKDKYLQWKVQEFITGCSVKLSGQNGLNFSTWCSVQYRLCLLCVISGLDWNLSRICQTSQEAAAQLHRAGLNRAWQSPGMSQGASPGTGMSWEFV